MAIKQPKIIGRIIGGKFVPTSQLPKEEEKKPFDFNQTLTDIANRQQGTLQLPVSSVSSNFSRILSGISQQQQSKKSQQVQPQPSFFSRLSTGLKETGKEVLQKSPLVQAVQQKSFRPFGEAVRKQFTGTGFQLDASKERAQQQGQEAMSALFMGPSELTTGASVAKNLAKKAFNPTEYVSEQVAKQQAARKAETGGILQKGKDFYNVVKRKLVDLNAPIEDTIRDAQKQGKFEILPKYDITNQIDRTLRSSNIGGQFAKDNGLDQVIRSVDNLDEFDQYLIAKHAKTLEQNGIKTGRNIAKDSQLVDALSPKYEQQAQVVKNYSQKLLDYSVDSGLISRELAESLKKKYPDYVPMQRIFNELEQGTLGTGKGVASIGKQTVVQKIKGSEREIESPIQSLLAKTGDAFKQGEKNKTAKILAGYKDLPNNPFNLRELGKNEVVGNKNTVSFLDNGVKRTFETTPEIANAAKNLNEQQMNILGKIFAAPVRLAKIGITGINLPFVAANVIKDQMFGAIMSNKAAATSVANPVNFVKSLFSAVGHGKLYDDMVRQGAMGTSFDIARSNLPQTVAKVRAGKNVASNIAYKVTHPGELLKTVEDIVGRSEELTRIQQYKGTLDALVKEGRTIEDAKILASRAARENTVNFARRGEWGTVLNSAFLYLNANIQGARTLVRNLKTKPVATTAKLATVLYTPVAISTAWNMSDPKRKEAYDDISDYEKENNIIIVPDNPVKDEKTGKWNVIKIPLTPGISNSAQVVRKGVEQSYGADPVRFGEVAKSLIGTVSPIEPSARGAANTLTPQAIKPSLEALTNQSFFTGLPTVPQSKQKLSPEFQVKEGTSGTARQIAGQLGVSPLKTEAFIRGTGGGVAMQALNASDRILAKFGVIPEDQIGGQNLIQAITARFSGATGGNASKKQEEILNDLITKQANERFITKQTAEKLYEEWKKLPKDEANAKAEELKKTDKTTFESLKSVAEDEKLGLTYSERLVKQLGVSNGERAKFIMEEAKKLKTREEKNAYIEDLRVKKIVSDEVIKQLRALNK